MLKGVVEKLKAKVSAVRRDGENKKRIKDAHQRVEKKP